MLIFILIMCFIVFSCIESISYGYYEIKVNQNRLGGSILIILAIIGAIFATIMYFVS